MEKNYDNIVYALTEQGLRFTEPVYLALDEIQLVKNTPSVLKYLYDHYEIKFFVSGSKFVLSKNLFQSRSPATKKFSNFYPLDFGEYHAFHGIELPTTPHDWRRGFSSPLNMSA